MSGTLIVYFSRSGNTARLAAQLADRLNADISPILETRSRKDALGILRSLFEALSRRRPPIRPPEHQPAVYDLVIVGTPVWASHMASPVRSYLGNYGPHCKQLAFFCTMGGSGAEKAFAEMAQLAGTKPLATLAVRADQLGAGTHLKDIKLFTYELGRNRASTKAPEGNDIQTVPRFR